MRKWIPVALIVLAVAWYIAVNAGSSMAMSEISARPFTALLRDGTRIAVQKPGEPAASGEAALTGGAGITFGYRFTFTLPDGAAATCAIRFRSVSCSDGWTAERGP